MGFLYFGTGKMVPWSFSLKRHAVEMAPPAFLPPVPRKLEIEQRNDSFFFSAKSNEWVCLLCNFPEDMVTHKWSLRNCDVKVVTQK